MHFTRLGGLSCLLLATVATVQAQAPQTGVLCAYVIYSGAMLDSEVCSWADTPAGEAVRKAVADMEAHILANSSRPVAEYRSNYAAGLSSMLALSDDKRTAYCEGKDPDRPNYFGGLRFEDPVKMTEEVSELLSRPGEPGHGDCF